MTEKSESLKAYFLNADSHGIIDHAIRATVNRVSGQVEFYIHPDGKDGETMDFICVDGNTLVLKFGCASQQHPLQ